MPGGSKKEGAPTRRGQGLNCAAVRHERLGGVVIRVYCINIFRSVLILLKQPDAKGSGIDPAPFSIRKACRLHLVHIVNHCVIVYIIIVMGQKVV